MNQEPQLQNLLAYTIFHIGVYISLFTALIAASVFGARDRPVLRGAVVCLFIAGSCGAIVGSNIPNYATYQDYTAAKFGPLGAAWFPAQTWINVEHLAFWLGVLLIVVPYLRSGKSAFVKS